MKVRVYVSGVPTTEDKIWISFLINNYPVLIQINKNILDSTGQFIDVVEVGTADCYKDKFRRFVIDGESYYVDISQCVINEPVATQKPQLRSIQSDNDGKYDKKDTNNLNADIRAAARGQVVVEPKPNELFVDIDSRAGLETFWKTVGWLEDLVTGYDIKDSKTKDHKHIVVRLSRDVKDAFERIGLQAILGSDNLREVLSWRNAVHQSGRPTCFFEAKPGTVQQDEQYQKNVG